MTDPSSSASWQAVMAQALEESGGPLTPDELAWASQLGLSLEDPKPDHEG